MKIGLILYTIRDILNADPRGTLEKVAAMGYKNVELAGIPGGLSPEQFKQILDDCGLTCFSAHVGIDEMRNDMEGVIARAKLFGQKYVVLPWVSQDFYAEGWAKAATETMLPVAKQLKEAGLQFCYHNHAFEFEKEGDQTGWEVLWNAADPAYIHAELDAYWVATGGDDPAEWITKLSGRVPMVHWKDMGLGEDKRFEEVGQGRLDWHSILAACREAGTEWCTVEMDITPNEPLHSIKVSRDFMVGLGLTD